MSAQQMKPTDIPMMRGANDPVGVPQECITVFDASRYLTDAVYGCKLVDGLPKPK